MIGLEKNALTPSSDRLDLDKKLSVLTFIDQIAKSVNSEIDSAYPTVTKHLFVRIVRILHFSL